MAGKSYRAWTCAVGAGLSLMAGAFPAEAAAAAAPAPNAAPAPSSAALEALQRLKGLDLEANPTLKAAVMRVVEGTRRTPAFVELVRDFRLSGQEAGLLDVAAAHPGHPAAAEALRLVLAGENGAQTVTRALAVADASGRSALLTALANASEQRAIPILSAAAVAREYTTPQRATALRGLAATEPGAKALLDLGRGAHLDDAARTTAGLLLAQSRWEMLRTESSKVFPPPQGRDGQSLPALSELVKKSGDPARGRDVFRGEHAACIKCHRVGDDGIDFGPALSQIGSKLGKQALYESILDPSAGIAFGYEGWSIETRSGEEVFGIVASETPGELAVRQQSGVVLRIPKADVVTRQQQQLSIMPAGLTQLISTQELVDLVEYLTTLRAPSTGGTP